MLTPRLSGYDPHNKYYIYEIDVPVADITVAAKLAVDYEGRLTRLHDHFRIVFYDDTLLENAK